MTDIQTKGCPDGIEAIDMSSMSTWIFEIAVLGDETIYRVCDYLAGGFMIQRPVIHSFGGPRQCSRLMSRARNLH